MEQSAVQKLSELEIKRLSGFIDRDTPDVYYFWGHICSQWFPAEFVIDDVWYNCTEQYMMAEKARCFEDWVAEKLIMHSKSPKRQKALGRKVKNFDSTKWNEISRLVVYRANLAKFTQNFKFLEFLLSTGDKEIVEASPDDVIWGIGLAPNDPDVEDRSKWRGKNWLGIACMQVRSDIRSLMHHGDRKHD